MRKALQPYVNQYVLGSGWITDWENMDNGSTRVYVAQPTLRKPNKHILFEFYIHVSTAAYMFALYRLFACLFYLIVKILYIDVILYIDDILRLYF